MKVWPEFDHNGDLPIGVHPATLDEVLQHFGTPTLRRRLVAQRLERIYKLAISTGAVARFVVYGSFITSKPAPNDVDVFMLMEDSFDSNKVTGEAALVFDHPAAQNVYGASVSGSGGWRQSVASKRRLSIGKSNGTNHSVES
jgi:hypothetical protein